MKEKGPNLFKAWEELPLLEFLIDEGIATLTSHFVLPNTSLEKILGYTSEQLSWCISHEEELLERLKNIWFNPCGMENYLRYFSGLDPNIPPRTGYFIGLRLVQKFLEKHPEISKEEIFDIPAEEIII